MQVGSVPPLYPLDGFVLLPTLEVEVTPVGSVALEVIGRASQHNDLLVASLSEQQAVHEVRIRAQVVAATRGAGRVIFRGLNRCRVQQPEAEDTPVGRAEDFPDTPQPF